MDLQRKLETSRARALMDYPFFGSLLCPMRLEESDKVPTLGTDGVKIFYSFTLLEEATDHTSHGILLAITQ